MYENTRINGYFSRIVLCVEQFAFRVLRHDSCFKNRISSNSDGEAEMDDNSKLVNSSARLGDPAAQFSPFDAAYDFGDYSRLVAPWGVTKARARGAADTAGLESKKLE